MERPVEVVVSDLHLAAGRLRDAGQRLQDGLSGVDLETRELLGSGWKGGAASAFSGAWDQWHNGAGQVIRGVQTMSELLRVAADQYARADEQGADAIGSASPERSAGSAPAAGGSEPPGAAASGAATPTGSGSSTGSAGSAGSASGAAASGASDAVSQVGQLGGQVSSGLAQAAQTAAGVAQQVGQAVEQIVEQAVQQAAEADKRDEAAPPSDEQPPRGEVPR